MAVLSIPVITINEKRYLCRNRYALIVCLAACNENIQEERVVIHRIFNFILSLKYPASIYVIPFVSIDLIRKSHNASVPYPTMHYFLTEMCTFLLQNGVLCDICLILWNGSVLFNNREIHPIGNISLQFWFELLVGRHWSRISIFPDQNWVQLKLTDLESDRQKRVKFHKIKSFNGMYI